MSDPYYFRGYEHTVSDGCDALSIDKPSGNPWCHIKMLTNDRENGRITIRSRAQLEQLHFMLGQVLATRSA